MKEYIVEGNTVRQLEREYKRPFVKKASVTAIRNREKAAHMNAGYVAFLLFMAGVLFVGCTAYINLRNGLIEKQKSVERLESQVQALRLVNNEEYDREEIKKIAMNELHMKYPDSEQVSITENNESDYVRQYREIPSE